MIPGGWELIVIVGVLLLLFGAKKLPDMARSIGQSARVFKGEMKGLRDDEQASDPAKEASPTTDPAPAKPAPLPPAPANTNNAETASEPQSRSGQ